MTVLVHHLGPWLPIMPLDTPGPLLDHCCIQSLGIGPRRWFRVDQGGPQWSRVVQGAPEGKSDFVTFLLMLVTDHSFCRPRVLYYVCWRRYRGRVFYYAITS